MDFLDRTLFFPGRIIVREGTPITAIILIVRGSVRVRMASLTRQYVFGPGAVIGFRSIVDGSRQPVHQSTVVAVDEVECIRLDYTDLKREFDEADPLVKRVFQSVFLGADAILKAYQMDSEKRRKTLNRLNEEIEAILKADAG